jgi:DNA-directed RNA polymerase II subunit RPB1
MYIINLVYSHDRCFLSPLFSPLLPSSPLFSSSLKVIFPDSMEDIPGTGDRKQNLSAKKVHEILSAISEEDIIALGFHPKHR